MKLGISINPFCCLALILLLSALPLHAQSSVFDLAGPRLDVRVERRGKTLPISEVPNLQPGDRVWVHPDFPENQSSHYLLIVAFLRGSTNPPPNQWFIKVETWDRSVRQEGAFAEVPKEAQQALIFLAPETTGDFATLRAAVRGRPGAFVRAVQDLQQAALDRMRLEKYLDEIKSTSDSDPNQLQQRSVLLARSLKMKLEAKCFDRPPEQQAACLTQNADQLVLDDPHTQSMVAQLANGTTVDLMNQLSYSRLGGGGAYSAYIGAIVDLARIMGSMHSAQYQYIPALAVPHRDSLTLKLNNPPSFRKPKSVLVIALPALQRVLPLALRALGQTNGYCAEDPSLVLSADGAPLVFATEIAHGIFLHVSDDSGNSVDWPVHPDASKGGFVPNDEEQELNNLGSELTGRILGMWGFEQFQGPEFKMFNAHPQSWSVASGDGTALIVGREDSLHVSAQNLACVNAVSFRDDAGRTKKVNWKISKPDILEIKLPLQNAHPGPVSIEISQYGLTKSDEIALQAYAEAARVEHFRLHSGDSEGMLDGKRLDEVSTLELHGIRFEPEDLDRRNDHDELRLRTQQRTDALTEAQLTAHVRLKDGREFSLPASVSAPRPKVTLISKGVQSDDNSDSSIRIGSDDDLPATGRIVFFIKSITPATFSRAEMIEVADLRESFRTMLSISDDTLMLQDSRTAVGILDPEKRFGTSAFGPLQFRIVGADGTTGDWQPLGRLIRLPMIKEIRCAPDASKSCLLTGANLFLLAAVSADPSFEAATVVPDGFTPEELQVPHPIGPSLYLKLRDDPVAVQTVTVPVLRSTIPLR
jgi:hypothetical protein